MKVDNSMSEIVNKTQTVPAAQAEEMKPARLISTTIVTCSDIDAMAETLADIYSMLLGDSWRELVKNEPTR